MRFGSAFLILFFLYFFIFQPPLFNKIYYLIIWLSFFVLFSFFNIRFLLKYIQVFRVEIVFGLSVVFVSLIRDLVSGELVYFDRFLLWFFTCLIFPSVILSCFFKCHRSIEELEEKFLLAVYAAVVCAGILTVALMYIPSFDSAYEAIQVDAYYDLYASFDVRYRAYGISENLTFTYGYILGLFAAYSLIKYNGNPTYIFIFLILINGVAVNARVGFLPVLVVLFFFVFIKPKIGLMVFFLVGTALSFFMFDASSFLSERWSWAEAFFADIIALLKTGRFEGTLAIIFGDFIVIPDSSFGQLFGEGQSLFGASSNSSDIGFILQLYYGGVFFVALLTLGMLFISLRLFKVLGKTHWFPYMFAFSFVVLNTKGFYFAGTPGARVLFLIYVFYIFLSHFKSVSMSMNKKYKNFVVEEDNKCS